MATADEPQESVEVNVDEAPVEQVDLEEPKEEPLKGGDDAPAPVTQEADNDGPALKRTGTVFPEMSTKAFNSSALGHMIGICLSSCVELIAVCELSKNTPGRGFGIVMGAVSVALTFIMAALFKFQQPMVERLVAPFSLFMGLWWAIGAAYLTFSKPFTGTSNGYFATWAACIMSFHFAQISVMKFKAMLGKTVSRALAGNLEKRLVMLILMISIVFVYACLVLDTEYASDDYKNKRSIGIIFGIISIAFIVIYQLIKIFKGAILPPTAIKYLSYVLIAVWGLAACFTTFGDFGNVPFAITGNGYFAGWGGAAVSLYLAKETTLNPSDKTPRD